jgi:hypothetical protein
MWSHGVKLCLPCACFFFFFCFCFCCGFRQFTFSQGKHRVHVLFSGTSLVTLNETSAGDAIPHIPSPPNKGCVAYVLRTGFASSQGSLMQMIEFSQQSVHGDVKETGVALLILLVFALISAAYVMKVGLEKKEKTTHELLLKCVMIITSVIPQQFPMQMAVAVNVALMALMKVIIRSHSSAAHHLIIIRLESCASSPFACLSRAKSRTASSTKRALSPRTSLYLTASSTRLQRPHRPPSFPSAAAQLLLLLCSQRATALFLLHHQEAAILRWREIRSSWLRYKASLRRIEI